MATAPDNTDATAPVATKADPKPADPKVQKAAPKPVFVRAVYGRMVDPLTALEYTTLPTELYKRTSWVDSQLEAKKLELCDPPQEAAAA